MDYEYKGIRLGDSVEKALDKLEREYIEFDKLFNALIYRKKWRSRRSDIHPYTCRESSIYTYKK